MNSVDKDAPCPCGSTKKYKHCCLRKELRSQQAMQSASRKHAEQIQQAILLMRAGNLSNAQYLLRKVASENPNNIEAQRCLCVLDFQMGRKDEALISIRRLAEHNTTNPQVLGSLANMEKEVGNLDEAIANYQRALEIQPRAPDILNNLATALAGKLLNREAINIYNQAIAMEPRYVDAISNLAVSLEAVGLKGDAKVQFEKALALNPDYPYAQAGLSRLERDNYPLAVQLIEKALRFRPDNWIWWMHLASLHQNKGDIHSAMSVIERGLQVRDSVELRMHQATLVPAIMGTIDEVLQSRQMTEKRFESLIEEGAKYHEDWSESVRSPFYLAYQGFNDRAIMELVARFYLQALPKLGYVAPHCSKSAFKSDVRKVGFVSLYARAGHSVGASFAGILNSVAADERFKVTLISGDDLTDEQMDAAYPALARQRVVLPANLRLAQQLIAELELDILVYLDIGMNTETYSLAFARLAPVQCVLGGHPVTTGIPNMDYYLSADLIEPSNAQEHYSEKLVRLQHGAFYFRRPKLPNFDKSRADLSMPTDSNIYLCPMTLFKLHPAFDVAIEGILQKDQNGVVVFMKDMTISLYHELLGRRFDKTISPSVRDRIIFHPWIYDKQVFMQVIESVEVILDPFHFGIGTTAIWTIAVGTPFVTLPGEFMRERVGYYYAKLLNMVDDCVAASVPDYITKAVELATQNNLRARIKDKMLKQSEAFFENEAGADDVKKFLATCELSED